MKGEKGGGSCVDSLEKLGGNISFLTAMSWLQEMAENILRRGLKGGHACADSHALMPREAKLRLPHFFVDCWVDLSQ